jgi:ABC transport system ATP-binding/permease protein
MPRLRGLGREIPVGPRAVLGRDPNCDVVLDDPSVSRRHAALESDGNGAFRLRDLASANGTFLDGIRIGQSGVPVSGGARLRFGEVQLQLVDDAAPARAVRRRALVATGAVAIFLCGALLLRGRSSAATAPARLPPSAAALVEQAASALEGDHPDEAEALAQQAVEADPFLDAARAVLARSRREREASRLYAQAMAVSDAAVQNEALHLLARVPQDSRLFARARIRAKELAGTALRAHGAACRAEWEAERWSQAIAECSSALEISCQTRSPDPLLALLREAERKAERKVEWSCPSDLAPLLRDEASGPPALAPDSLLAERHPDPKVRAAVFLYLQGEPSDALRALSHETSQAARAAADRIRKAEGRSREGRTALLAGDLLRSDRAYAEVLRLDAELVPQGVDSVPARQIREALARAHGRAGDDHFAKGQYASAFDEWQAALSSTPRDPRLLDSIARLDEIARGLLDDPKASCADLGMAAHVASSGGPVRDAAEKALSRCR